MEIRRSLVAPCDPERLFSWVEDLDFYPRWMDLVHDVEPVSDASGDDAWNVVLQARVGPFARSKALRMVRTEHVASERVTFERRETDGRQHSEWVLQAVLTPRSVDTTDLTMELRYGGGLWAGAVLQRVLDDAVKRGSESLIDVVSTEPTR